MLQLHAGLTGITVMPDATNYSPAHTSLLICSFCTCPIAPRIPFTGFIDPLDGRPPCLRLTKKMGLISKTEVISPPSELSGRFTPGRPL